LKRHSLIAVFLLLSISLVAPAAQAQPRYGGTLVWGVSSEPPNLIGAGVPTWVFQQVTQQMFNTLVRFDPRTFEWKPELAESWKVTVTDGRMTVGFNLLRNASWHDGKPFTSADVKFTYEKIAPLFNSFIATMMRDHVESIETPDDFTVVFKFKRTWAIAFDPGTFGGSAVGIMPKHLYEGTDIPTNPYNVKPVGTGPWKFKEWKKGEYIIVERNEKYWKKGLPYLDRIIFKIITSPPAMALAVEKGEIDFVWSYGLAFADAIRLQSDIGVGKLAGKKVWFWPSPCGSEDTVAFNIHPEGPPVLKDVRVRQAIAAAIDRRKIAEVVYFGRQEPLDGPLSPAPANSLYYDPKIKQQSFDPELANKLLDEAGYKKGPDGIRFSLRISVDPVSYPFFLKEAEVMRDYLKAVGIDAKIVTLETAAWHEATFRRWDYDISIFPFCYGPGVSYLIQYWSTRGIAKVSWSNVAGYSNPEFDKLLYQAESEVDKTKHIDLVKKALKILAEDQPAIWTASRTMINALNLDFSDELQPGSWENSGGQGYDRMEGIYWLKAPPPVKEVVKEVQIAYVPAWVYAVVVVLIMVAAGAVAYAVRRKPQ